MHRRVIGINKLLASWDGFLLSSKVPLNDVELALFINWVVNNLVRLHPQEQMLVHKHSTVNIVFYSERHSCNANP